MLIIQNKDGSTSSFEVRRFLYTDALSACYGLTLEVLDVNNRLPESCLLRPATLQFADNTDAAQSYSGVITDLTQFLDPLKQKLFYQITIEPALTLLRLERTLQVCNQQSYLEIAQQLIQHLAQQQGLDDYATFEISLPWLTAKLQTYDIHCEDNYLAYFNKLLGFARYYFQQNGSSESLVVVDRPGLLPAYDQVLLFDPTRKEDLHNTAPAFYSLTRQQQADNLSSRLVYFDANNPEASLKLLTKTDPLVYEFAQYAPLDQHDFIKAKLNEQMRHHTETYSFKSYYSHLQVGERITVQSVTGNGSLEVFIESLQIEGHYQHDRWRFDVTGTLRPYDAEGLWLGAPQIRKPLPAALTGGLLQPDQQVNDAGEYQVKLPLGFNPGEVSPVINVREIQETVTESGGASRSVSGSSDTTLLTRNGLPCDLLMAGSVIDNQRASHINSESYRETGVVMQGGLKMHMRRQDGESSYSETGILLKDNQDNAAHITLGANARTLSEQGDRAHGILQQSTGYAKRLAAANDYATVGDPNNPVTQKAIVNQGGKTIHSTQTHVGTGSYSQTYYTDAVGVKTDNSPAPAKALQPNPALAHYFYVLPAKTHISNLADQLFGADSSPQKKLFTHINLQAYDILLPAGTWAYVPVKQQYQADDIAAVHQTLTHIQTEVDQNQSQNMDSYGLWHQIFGWNFDNTISYTGAFFATTATQINNQFSKISQTLNNIGRINQQAKTSILAAKAADAATYREQAQILGEELHQDIHSLVNLLGLPDTNFASGFTADTGLPFDRNILGFKVNNLTDNDLHTLSELKTRSLQMAATAKGLGRLGMIIDGVSNANDIAETCQQYGNGSTLCHKTAIGDTSSFAAGEYVGSAIGDSTTAWLGCNATFDIETLGLGVIGCTVAVGATSIVAGNIAGDLAKLGSTALYQTVIVYSQKHNISNLGE